MMAATGHGNGRTQDISARLSGDTGSSTISQLRWLVLPELNDGTALD